MRIDIVVPCYNEQLIVRETSRRLLDLMNTMSGAGSIEPSSRLLFVDDGSSDDTWPLIEALAREEVRVAGIRLSRNRGHQVALLAGLLESDADAVISIDADLQDDIGVIPEMIDCCRSGCDIVYGVRRQRTSDTLFKRASAAAFYRLLRVLGVDLVEQHADFRLLSRRALDCLKEYRETSLFLRGLVPQLGLRSARVSYDRSPRLAGTTKYPLRRMIGLAIDGVTSFSAAPLRLAAGLGALTFLASIAMSGWVLWIRFVADSAIPGWASTVIPMYFLGGIQLLCLGVVGEYLARVFMEVKGRPKYFIETRVGIDGTASTSGEACRSHGKSRT